MRRTAAQIPRHFAAVIALLLCAPPALAATTECCTSIAPEFPPATPYGASLYRDDDSRARYSPYIPPRQDAPATIEQLEQQVTTRESLRGAYDWRLSETLGGLGAAYLADQRFLEAKEAYARAIHLLRVNEGLRTPTQQTLVEQLIEAELAAEKIRLADQQQKYLFDIRRANYAPGDPQFRVAVERYADWQRAAYLAEIDGERYLRLMDLIDLYRDIDQEIASEHGESSPELLPYLQGKLKAEYLMSIYPGEKEEGLRINVRNTAESDLRQLAMVRFYKFKNYNYRFGTRTAQRIVDIVEQNPESTRLQRVEALVALADWYQWHRQYAKAVPLYEQAWQELAQEAEHGSWLDENFGEPVELPAAIVFQPGRLALRASNSAEVQVRYRVSRHGKAKGIDVLSPSKDEQPAAAIRTYKYLRDMRFRPVVREGKVVESDAIERRYHIRY